MKVRYFALSCALLGVCGCGQTVHMEVPTSGVIAVRGPDSVEHNVPVQSDCSERLSSWVGRNSSGWQRYFATPPSGGVWVNLGPAEVRFYETAVLARTSEGWVSKSTPFVDYGCLITDKANGT
jgi:hypothetical protein